MDIRKLTFLAVLVLILLKVVVYQNFFFGREAYFFSDDAIYATLSERFLKGDFWHAFHPYWSPGFPIATVPFYLISGSWEKAQFLVSATSVTILILVLYRFYRKYSLLLSFSIAFIAAFSISLQKLVTSGGMTEPLYILLLWSGIFFSWLALKESTRRFYALTGIFFGLAYFTRTEAMAIFVLFIFIATLSFTLRKRRGSKILNKLSGISLLVAAAVYFYFPLARLTKVTTFGFNNLNTTSGFVLSLPFLIIGLLGIFFEVKKIRSLNVLKNIFTKISIALAVFLLVNLPYIIFISIELGRPTLSGKYAFVGTGPYYALEKDRVTTMAQDIWSTDYIDYSSPYFNPKRATDYIIKNFENGSMTQNAWKLFLESLVLYQSINTNNFFVGFGLYMAIVGFAFGVLNAKFRMLTLYLVLLCLIGIVWVSFFMSSNYRYLVFALPLFFYLQALTIYASGLLTVFLAKLFFPSRKIKFVSLLIIILPSILLADFFIRNAFAPRQHTDLDAEIDQHHKIIGDWIRLKNVQNIKISYLRGAYGGDKDHKIIGEYIKSQNIKVMGGRVEAIPFYANAKLVYMPSSPPNDIVSYMKAWGVEYLLVRPLEVGYDFVAPIASPKFKHPDLSLFKRFEDGSLIWRIKLTEEEKKNNLRLERERKLDL